MTGERPLPRLAATLNGVEHPNCFEQRATEYSKVTTRRTWNEVSDGVDKRQKAKASVRVLATNEDAEGGNLFSRAGFAAK